MNVIIWRKFTFCFQNCISCFSLTIIIVVFVVNLQTVYLRVWSSFIVQRLSTIYCLAARPSRRGTDHRGCLWGCTLRCDLTKSPLSLAHYAIWTQGVESEQFLAELNSVQLFILFLCQLTYIEWHSFNFTSWTLGRVWKKDPQIQHYFTWVSMNSPKGQGCKQLSSFQDADNE